MNTQPSYPAADPIPTIQQAIQSGDLASAETLCLQYLELDPENPDLLFLLGMIAQRTGNQELAVGLFEQAIAARPAAVFHFNLGISLRALGDRKAAEGSFRQTLTQNPNFAPAYQQLGQLLYDQGQIDEAQAAFQTAVDLGLLDLSLLFDLAVCLREQNRTEEAITLFREIYHQDPNHLSALLHSHLTLPIIYEHEADIHRWRERYTQGLNDICQIFESVSTDIDLRQKQKAISRFAPFYLNYQCQNDRDLQIKYGALVSDITQQLYPQRTSLAIDHTSRIRIGFLSASLFKHSVGRSSLSWVEGLDHEQFEIYCYHVGRLQDEVTERYRQSSDHFYHFPEEITATAQQVIEDDLQLLVFLDIGMFPLMTQIGSLRLAPIQCVRWGHPITTGLPTIDYYISSEAMEPENGQEHYSEQLVLLPGLGKALLDPPDPSTTQPDRAEFSLPADRILYLASQSLIKYLPQYDDIFPQLIARIPEARIVFMARASSQRVVDQFQERLKRAFARYGLEGAEHCLMIPKLGYRQYVRLNLCCDVFLDSLGWSGDNTVLDAVACGLPVVTQPGHLMRSRHAAGILNYLGVTETITESIPAYLDMAVRLGQDGDYRAQISEQIKQCHQQLQGDEHHIRFLDSFYQQVVQDYLDRDTVTHY